MDAPAVKTGWGAPQGSGGMAGAMGKGAAAGNLPGGVIRSALAWAKDFTTGPAVMAAGNANAEASLQALANAHGVGAAAAARQVAAINK